MKKIFIALAFLFIGAGFISTPSAKAAPAPYTGGAAVVKVLYPADGSTVTITATGAVIKQSPGHSAYREGWIDPDNICNISVAGDLQGQIKPGSSNPYTTNGQTPTRISCGGTSNTAGGNTSPSTNPTPSVSNSTTSNINTSSNANANASATANVVATNSQPEAATQSSVVTTAAAPSSSSSSQTQSSSSTAKALPNTGPGAVLPAFGISTILGTIGHSVFTRRRSK